MFFPKEEVGRVPMDRRCSVAECYRFHFYIWINTLQTSEYQLEKPWFSSSSLLQRRNKFQIQCFAKWRSCTPRCVLPRTWLRLLGEGDCHHIENSTHYSEATYLLHGTGVVSGHSGGLARWTFLASPQRCGCYRSPLYLKSEPGIQFNSPGSCQLACGWAPNSTDRIH